MSAIATWVIEQGGIVFGSALNEKNEVRHIFVESVDELWRFRNSKYVQSLIGKSFKDASRFLKEGRLVCFSGTPCQMEGLLRYLRKPFYNLIIVDVVCRAVPSPKVLRKYLEYQAGKYGNEITDLKFRSKQNYGYKYSNLTFTSTQGKYNAGIDSDPWLRSFFSGINVRPCCFDCRFKKRYHKTDITIWDCFEVWKFDHDLDNDKGVTRVLAHSDRGKEIMQFMGQYAMVKSYDPKELTVGVIQMLRSQEENPRRAQFFKDLDTMSAKQLFTTYFPVTCKNQFERTVRLTMLRLGLYKYLKKIAKKLIGEIKR